MGKLKAITYSICAVSIAVLLFGYISQVSHIDDLERELETSQLHYSYAKEMLDSFMYDENNAEDQMKKIREIQKQPSGTI